VDRGDLNPQQICDSDGFHGRTVEAVNEQLERCRFVVARQKAFVETIEPSEDALSVEEVVKLFSTASSLLEIAYSILSLGYGIINVRFENFLR
jgi:hypothetical protein